MKLFKTFKSLLCLIIAYYPDQLKPTWMFLFEIRHMCRQTDMLNLSQRYLIARISVIGFVMVNDKSFSHIRNRPDYKGV